MRVPINDLKELAEKRGLTHVIVWAFDSEKVQHVATYGRNVEECSQAADFGNKLKDTLGWPESLHAQPSRVRRLQARIKELEAKLAAPTEAA
jgi:hypothetical protein